MYAAPLKKTTSLIPTPTSTWSYIYEALFVALCNFTVPWHNIFMTLLPHIHITEHIHYIMYPCQQILVTILEIHHTHYNIQPLPHKSLAWCISYIIYLSHHISITPCEHCNIWESHIAPQHPCCIYPLHHIPTTWNTNSLHHGTACTLHNTSIHLIMTLVYGVVSM